MPLQIDYSVSRTWKTGFEGTISVTNTGTAPVTDWQVTFDFFDVTLTDVNDAAIIAETERIYTVAPLPNGLALLPGGTATFGFTARGNAARLPLFIDDEDDDLFDELGEDDDPAIMRLPVDASPWQSGPPADHLMPTDGLMLDDGQVRDLLARVDWMYFEGGAMNRVQSLLGMGDRMPLPRPANENMDPLSKGSSSSSSNGSTSVPAITPAVGGLFGTATDAMNPAAMDAAGPAVRPAQPHRGGRDKPSDTEPSSSRSRHRPARAPQATEAGTTPPFPPIPPRDDWFL